MVLCFCLRFSVIKDDFTLSRTAPSFATCKFVSSITILSIVLRSLSCSLERPAFSPVAGSEPAPDKPVAGSMEAVTAAGKKLEVSVGET